MNKEDIIAILMSNLRPMKETRLAVLEQIADEIMALLAQPVAKITGKKIEGFEIMDEAEDYCPCGMPVSLCGGPDAPALPEGGWPKFGRTYDKLSEVDPEKFPVRVEERPGGKTIYPVDIACSIHEDDCECRQCRPDLWFQQDDVWTKKI